MPEKKPAKKTAVKAVAKEELPVKPFKTLKEWARWLELNHARSKGVWLRLYKKDSGVKTVSRPDALDEALCHGWIDGHVKPGDALSWLQKFTPRRPRGTWSKRNIEFISRLTEAGRMKPAGVKEVEAAKNDGRWARAYDSPSTMKVPEDLLKHLSKNKKAKAFFETLNKASIYAINWRLQTAVKPETRERRMKLILEMLRKGEKFH